MADTVDEDRDHLHQLGYAQELHRGMSTFSNFAISFSIISILAGGMTSFWLGMRAIERELDALEHGALPADVEPT